MKTKVFKIIISSLAAALLLTPCLISEEGPNTPVSPNITMTKADKITITAIPSLPYTPTTEPTKIPEATWTPRPTLSEEEAFILVEDLLRNNAGCRLPCLWGITPGITTWDEANHFFTSFASEIRIGGEGYRPSSNAILYASKDGRDSWINFVVSNTGDIKVIRSGGLSTEFIGQLDFLLREYGLPEHIFIRTFGNSLGSYLPFTLVLYYQEQGILAKYKYDGQLEGNVVVACPSPGGSRIMLWAEDIEFTLEEIETEVFGSDPTTHLRNLEDVTDYSYESFYQAFTDPTYSNCIETPAEHW